MKIGLYGGTFDPPHKGHTTLAYDFYKASSADLLIVMPSFIPPHKQNANTSALSRYEMARLAFLSLGEMGVNYTVSNYEITKNDTSYTIETVNHLLAKYNEEKICMCVGSDMLYYFEKWKCADELMKKCVLYSKAREAGEYEKLCAHGRYLEKNYGAEIHIMNGNVLEVSSTEIRNLQKPELLDVRVSAFIEKHGLYR